MASWKLNFRLLLQKIWKKNSYERRHENKWYTITCAVLVIDEQTFCQKWNCESLDERYLLLSENFQCWSNDREWSSEVFFDFPRQAVEFVEWCFREDECRLFTRNVNMHDNPWVNHLDPNYVFSIESINLKNLIIQYMHLSIKTDNRKNNNSEDARIESIERRSWLHRWKLSIVFVLDWRC